MSTSPLTFIKKVDIGLYHVYHKKRPVNLHVGDLVCGDDGYYSFWPRQRGGWDTSSLLEIADHLTALNRDWHNIVQNQSYTPDDEITGC